MGEKKVIRMLLKVDLQCCKCYKKVKKVLCSFPHVRDQVFDEKANTVTIKVVCCSPEKIRDKIRCKGGASIESIEILLDKPPAPPKLKPTAQPKPPEPRPPSRRPDPGSNDDSGTSTVSNGQPPSPERHKKLEKPLVQSIVLPGPVPGYPRTCYTECYQGHGGRPCNQMCYGQPVRYYDGYCGRPVYDSWGGGGSYRPCYATQSYGECFSNENPSVCTIM